MRSLDERLAEIHRRSEQILRIRKKRRQIILSVCIPAVLCVGIWLCWGISPVKESKASAQVRPEDSPESVQMHSQTQVNGMELSPEDGEQIQLLLGDLMFPGYGLLDESFEADSRGDMNEMAPADSSDQKFTDNSTSNRQSYSIRLVAEDGTEQEYLLTGNVLTEVSTGLSVELTNGQLQEILELIL